MGTTSVIKVTKELRTTKVRSCCNQDQENKIPDKVQVKKGESEQTDTSKIRVRMLEGMEFCSRGVKEE